MSTTTTEESPSRLRQAEQRAARAAATDTAKTETTTEEEVVRAEQRFARFRSKYKGGVHDAEIVRVIEHENGHVTFVVKASVWTERPTSSRSTPDATAYASRSTGDDDPIAARNPLATADTVARSRALRNLGILVNPPKKRKPKD